MSSPARPSFESSVVEFLNWLAVKTQRGEILWKRKVGLITTTLDDKLIVDFETTLTAGRELWNAFTIADPNGEELLRATPTFSAHAKRPFAAPLRALFAAVLEASRMH